MLWDDLLWQITGIRLAEDRRVRLFLKVSKRHGFSTVRATWQLAIPDKAQATMLINERQFE